MIESKMKEYGKGVATLIAQLFTLKEKTFLPPLTDFTQALMAQIALYSPIEEELDKALEIISWNIKFLEYLIANGLSASSSTTIYWLDHHNELQKGTPYSFIQETPVTLEVYSTEPAEIGLKQVIPEMSKALESRDIDKFKQILKVFTHIIEHFDMFAE